MKKNLLYSLFLVSGMCLWAGCALLGGGGYYEEEILTPPLPEESPTYNEQTKPFPNLQDESGEILVRIGVKGITRDEFEKRYTEYLLAAETDEEKKITKQEFFQNLILEELLWHYAQREEIDKDPEFRALVNRTKEKLLLEYILKKKLSEKIKVMKEEVAWYYNERMEDFTKPTRIQVRHILTATFEEAEEAVRRLEQGEDFGDVARDMSIHASRDVGGQLPPFSRGTYNKDFEDAAFSLKVGQRSPIIKTELGYHIIEKTGETQRTVTPFEEVKELIRTRIMREKRQRALESFFRRLRTETSVEILEQP